jgi:hypothetical protein
MPTREQLESALINADKAGDVDAAKALANAIKSNAFDSAPQPEATIEQVQQTEQVQQEQKPKGAIDEINDAILSTSTGKVLGEFAAASNKSIFQFLDFIGPNNVNAVLSLAGSDKRIPTFEGELAGGNYMDAGKGRDAVQGLGQLLPAAVGMAPIQGRNLASASGITQEALGLGAAKVTEPIKTAAKATMATIDNALPSKAKEAAKLPLYRGTGDVVTAGFKLDDAGRVIKDEVQKKALKAGIDEGAVAMISAANKETKSRLKEMVNVLETGRGNLEFRNFNPPQRVVGQSIKERLSIIQEANKKAAGNLDSVAETLKGKPVDVSPAINQFLEDLAGEGVTFNPKTGALNFSDSTIEGLTEAQRIIKRTVRRLYSTSDPTQNAHRVHTAKKFIDEQVSYGKTQAGLSGKMEGLVKRLRHNLDEILDKNFPEYDKVNTTYSETRSVIDEVQSLAGKKVNLMSDSSDKALGVMSRKVLSNYNTGAPMEDMFAQLDEVAKRYSTATSKGTNDELLKIISAESEIRKMFPSALKPNTFQGEIGAEVGRGAMDAATGNKIGLFKRAYDAAGKVFSKSDEQKIQALKDLLAE